MPDWRYVYVHTRRTTGKTRQMFKYSKVGGLRFLRIGRLQLSFCVCKPKIKEA